jgi:hypothetical protein
LGQFCAAAQLAPAHALEATGVDGPLIIAAISAAFAKSITILESPM